MNSELLKNFSSLVHYCGVRTERTVKRHILNWMKKASSRSHEKDQEELTYLKTNGGPFTTPRYARTSFYLRDSDASKERKKNLRPAMPEPIHRLRLNTIHSILMAVAFSRSLRRSR